MYIILFTYLNLCIGGVAGGSIPLKNIWREFDMKILRELSKSLIKIKQIKKSSEAHLTSFDRL